MISSKRGLSGVVVTALLILITISAIGIIAGFLIPFVRENLEETNCFEYRDYFEFDESFNLGCFHEKGSNKNYLVTIRPKTGVESDKINGMVLRFINQSIAEKVDVVSGELEGAMKMVDPNIGKLEIPENG
jgi:flagellin-like protein